MKRLWISAALILSLALLAGCHVLYLGRLTGELVDLLDPQPETSRPVIPVLGLGLTDLRVRR